MGLNTSVFLAADPMKDRIFGLDWQLVADICVSAVAIFVLFVFLSYVLFNPARNLLRKRQEFVANELAQATKDKEQANEYKAEYDAKLKDVSKESEAILSETRKKALKRENDIIAEAKAEAHRIVEHAGREAELEKSKVVNEVKQEMIAVASVMASKIVASSLDDKKQNELLDQALEEMGDDTWQN
ncbi:MAG: F0F1 ATP synthase subunit B [bacterium]|nr:F0F1 ATP synthase subunit B [bacterium]